MPQASDIQLAIFSQAVDALGGQRALARHLGIAEREVRDWISGDVPLDYATLRETARALITHSDMCRRLERKLSPAFSENLTEAQLEGLGTPEGKRPSAD
ncbi:MAG: helix-turn-helix domain-containing protein [Novosphingobium sp.]|nr:helix-turn-helix domain-containing protein [Novosphingobium sp.]